ncbi:fimbrial protein [Klebsiella aerogenes]|uniref:fimbrial protein n=1 Tax=Klebsiella aerogenes TaxID=548 RepID=UPI001F3A653E|nr:fimbrial protein [Klebsiella aerogenes]
MSLKNTGRLWRIILLLPLLSGGNVLAGNKHHVVVPGGIIHLRGEVAAGACIVSPESQDKVVVMGAVRSNQFSGVGSWADPVPFALQLIDCNTALSHQVGMVFSGVTDGKDPLVFSVGRGPGVAEGIGLGLFDADGELIVPNTQPRSFTLLNQGTVVVPLTAKYRATSQTVTPGEASTVVYFSLYYP